MAYEPTSVVLLRDPFVAALHAVAPWLSAQVVLRPALPCDDASFLIRFGRVFDITIDRERGGQTYRVDCGRQMEPGLKPDRAAARVVGFVTDLHAALSEVVK